MARTDSGTLECSFMMVMASPRMVAVEVLVRTGPDGAWSIECPETGAKWDGASGPDRTSPAAILTRLAGSVAIGERNHGQYGIEEPIVDQ